MNHIYGYPHSKEAEFYKLLLDYDESLERDLADCRAIWYESGTQNLMVGNYGMPDRIVSMIISKSFGFIGWLVQNDKIDRDKILKENGLFRKYFYDLEYVKNYDRLVMWLSVEDSPTKFLISYLK